MGGGSIPSIANYTQATSIQVNYVYKFSALFYPITKLHPSKAERIGKVFSGNILPILRHFHLY